MASTKTYLQLVLEQLDALSEISWRPMMGEFILYYRGKVAGGIYDNRLLVKAVPAAVASLGNPTYALPYEGAREMLLVEELENREWLCGLFRAMEPQLPAPKKKKSETT